VGTGICLTPQLGQISALAFMIDLHSRQYFSFGPFVVWIDIFTRIFLTPTRPHFSQSRQIHHNIAP